MGILQSRFCNCKIPMRKRYIFGPTGCVSDEFDVIATYCFAPAIEEFADFCAPGQAVRAGAVAGVGAPSVFLVRAAYFAGANTFSRWTNLYADAPIFYP